MTIAKEYEMENLVDRQEGLFYPKVVIGEMGSARSDHD
jgi:hypothetical protein